jgi:hypothetical protein
MDWLVSDQYVKFKRYRCNARFDWFWTSLAGCELALLSEDGYALFNEITTNAQTFNLSLMPDYENRYINHLLLKPIRGERS